MIPARLARSSKLGPYDKAVFIYIASFNPSYPSQRKISKDLGISRRVVQESVNKLCAMGVLVKTPGNTTTCNSYETNWSSYPHSEGKTAGVGYQVVQGGLRGSPQVGYEVAHNHINESEQINQREKLSVLSGKVFKKMPQGNKSG